MLNAFLKLGDLEGEVTAKDHERWIKLLSIDHVMDQKASPGPDGTGRMVAAVASHGVLRLGKAVDKTTPLMALKCSSGDAIAKAEIHFVRAAGDDRVPYYKIELEKVIIAQVKVGFDPGAAVDEHEGGEPTESIALRYNRIRWTYQPQDADGKVLGTITGGWDHSTQSTWA